MDPVLGIVKADIGVKDGRIVGVGQAGNPQVQDGVSARPAHRPGTEVISGEGLVATAGAIDSHIHFLTPGAGSARAVQRGDHADRRGNRSGRRLQGHDVHAGAVEPRTDARGHRGPAGQRRAARQGQQQPAGRARSSRSRPARAASRSTRTGARRPAALDCALTRRRRARRPGRSARRHAQRGRVPGRHDRRDRRTDDPQLPHGGSRWRPRTGHDGDRLAAQRAAVVDQPDPAVHHRHDRQPVLHDGVTHHLNPDNPEDVAFAQSRIRPRPRPPRTCCTTGRAQHVLVRLAGDGAHRGHGRRPAGGPRTR